MKKLTFIISAILISLASFAQSDTLRPEPIDTVRLDINDKNHPDGVMMTSGTMKLVKSGVVTPMEKDIVMSNGTTVQPDGTIIKKDNSRMMLLEGQHMDMAGKISVIKDTGRK